MPGGEFTSSPDQGRDVCQVLSDICQTVPTNRIYCKTEGRSVLICDNDLKRWRDRVASSTAERHRLQLRCPICADWISPNPSNRSVILQTTQRPQLQGPVANVLEKALHAEGFLIDQRTRILQRLAQDAPWLASSFIEPGFLSILEETDPQRTDQRRGGRTT